MGVRVEMCGGATGVEDGVGVVRGELIGVRVRSPGGTPGVENGGRVAGMCVLVDVMVRMGGPAGLFERLVAVGVTLVALVALGSSVARCAAIPRPRSRAKSCKRSWPEMRTRSQIKASLKV